MGVLIDIRLVVFAVFCYFVNKEWNCRISVEALILAIVNVVIVESVEWYKFAIDILKSSLSTGPPATSTTHLKPIPRIMTPREGRRGCLSVSPAGVETRLTTFFPFTRLTTFGIRVDTVSSRGRQLLLNLLAVCPHVRSIQSSWRLESAIHYEDCFPPMLARCGPIKRENARVSTPSMVSLEKSS